MHRWLLLLLLCSLTVGQGTPSPQSNQCFSTTSEYQQARITSEIAPSSLLKVRQMFSGPQVEVHCLDTSAQSPYGKNLLACSTSAATVLICWTRLDDNYTAAIVNKSACAVIYPQTLPQYIGDVNGPDFYWAFFIDLTSTPSYCFPRNVDVAMLATAVFPSRGSTLLLIVLVIVLVFLALCGLAFGGPRLKNHIMKLLRRGEEEALDLRPPPDARLHNLSPYEPAVPPALPMVADNGDLNTSKYSVGGQREWREVDEQPDPLEVLRGPSLYDMSLRADNSQAFQHPDGHSFSPPPPPLAAHGSDVFSFASSSRLRDRAALGSYSVIPLSRGPQGGDDRSGWL